MDYSNIDALVNVLLLFSTKMFEGFQVTDVGTRFKSFCYNHKSSVVVIATVECVEQTINLGCLA